MTRLSIPGVAAAQRWTPKLLGTGLKLWLDADDESTMTLSSGDISEWRDKSGNANHATQTTSTRRPNRETGVQNSRAVVRFNGTSDWFSTPFTMNGLASFATVLAFKANSKLGSRSLLREQVIADTSKVFAHPFASASVDPPLVIMNWDGWSPTGNDVGDVTVANINAFVRASGSTNKVFRNGTEQSTRTANSNAAAMATGSTLTIGAYAPTPEQWFSGDLYEVVIYSGSLSTADREKLEGYLAWRWGLNGSLPSGHPYKNYAP